MRSGPECSATVVLFSLFLIEISSTFCCKKVIKKIAKKTKFSPGPENRVFLTFWLQRGKVLIWGYIGGRFFAFFEFFEQILSRKILQEVGRFSINEILSFL
jgi:hypothetical protein